MTYLLAERLSQKVEEVLARRQLLEESCQVHGCGDQNWGLVCDIGVWYRSLVFTAEARGVGLEGPLELWD